MRRKFASLILLVPWVLTAPAVVPTPIDARADDGVAVVRADPSGGAAVPRNSRPNEGHTAVRIHVETAERLALLRRLDAQLLSCFEGLGDNDYVVSPEALETLDRLGVPYTVLDEDVVATIQVLRARIDRANATYEAHLAEKTAGVEDGLRALDVSSTEATASGAGADGPSWFDTYKELDAIRARAEELQAMRPDLVTLQELGASLEHRAIWAIRITGPGSGAEKPAVLFTATQHAREWQSPMVSMYLADQLIRGYDVDPRLRRLVDDLEILIVPMVNPDGYVYSWIPWPDGYMHWRKNRRVIGGEFCDGIDLNRNWDAHWGLDDTGSSGDPCDDTYRGSGPFSEPETRAVRDLILAHPNLAAHVDYHSYFQMILTPYGYTDLLSPDHDEHISRATLMHNEIEAKYQKDYEVGPVNSTVYPVNGLMNDWVYQEHEVFSAAVELRPGEECFYCFQPDPELLPRTCEENLAAALALMESLIDPVTWVFPEGRPAQVPSGVELAVAVQILAEPGVISPGSGSAMVYYRSSPSSQFMSEPLTYLGGYDYEATLPALGGAGSAWEYYFVVDTTSRVSKSPAEAPEALHRMGVVEPVYGWSFDVDPGWTTEGDWAFGQPTGEGGYYISEANFAYPDPDRGRTGWNVYGNNLQGDAVMYGEPVRLVTRPIDCTDLNNVQLRFWRWLNQHEYDWANVEVSNDGVTWHQVAGWDTFKTQENTWSQGVYDISEVADRQPAVYVRWTLRNTVESYTGWNIDDVEIWATRVSSCEASGGGVEDGLRLDPVNGTDLRLEWTPSVFAAEYVIERAETPKGPFVEIGRTTGEFWVDPDEMTRAVSRYYRVSACGTAQP